MGYEVIANILFLCYISALLNVAQSFFFFPLTLTYLEYAVEAVTVTILKHGGKAELKIPVIVKMAGQLCSWYKLFLLPLECHEFPV